MCGVFRGLLSAREDFLTITKWGFQTCWIVLVTSCVVCSKDKRACSLLNVMYSYQKVCKLVPKLLSQHVFYLEIMISWGFTRFPICPGNVNMWNLFMFGVLSLLCGRTPDTVEPKLLYPLVFFNHISCGFFGFENLTTLKSCCVKQDQLKEHQQYIYWQG